MCQLFLNDKHFIILNTVYFVKFSNFHINLQYTQIEGESFFYKIDTPFYSITTSSLDMAKCLQEL